MIIYSESDFSPIVKLEREIASNLSEDTFSG